MMWPGEEERARERMSEGGKVGQLATPSDAGKTCDRVAARLGVKPRSLVKTIAIIEARKEL